MQDLILDLMRQANVDRMRISAELGPLDPLARAASARADGALTALDTVSAKVRALSLGL